MNMSMQRLLVPVDGSEHSKRAVEYAAEMAKLIGAEVVLLHCHRTVPSVLGEPNFQDAYSRISATAEGVLRPYKDLLDGAGIAFKGKAVGGEPPEVIADVARAMEVDQIIMGNRGLSNLEGLLLGSVTYRVLQTAPCPVTVVR